MYLGRVEGWYIVFREGGTLYLKIVEGFTLYLKQGFGFGSADLPGTCEWCFKECVVFYTWIFFLPNPGLPWISSAL